MYNPFLAYASNTAVLPPNATSAEPFSTSLSELRRVLMLPRLPENVCRIVASNAESVPKPASITPSRCCLSWSW